MIAVHFSGHDRISIDEVPRPEPRDQDVVVRIRSAAICGTDRENLEGPGQEKVPGHESAGEFVLSEFSEMIALVRRGLPVEPTAIHWPRLTRPSRFSDQQNVVRYC